ncbi:D-hexose-6-phosphate mutarotase [Caviibacterium pharyngocola]|uniref:Putative glucose-6-phosphate 1-epimerase n=1 Tax=Caviibacterium pharyngocola TaxID=28159 RepID=A0A2M8RV20_9PAST|nr:D-hexose-6-phosphate mutarotase [Caviibacterium pharyngocola]PJG82733.1 D-hexose-6-phosphate mutarotase [Caviibacterium pharyngocola]
MTNITRLQQISPEISLLQYNELPVIKLNHSVGRALISLQGAHLFSWTPKAAQQDVFWLSEIEPFTQGNAIRGGVPICYPWFGPVQSPSHGYARISLWTLSDYAVSDEKVRLEFSLFSENHLIEAKIAMIFSQQCELIFTHYGQQPAQVALHSYFNISHIDDISVQGLPTSCFNSLTKQTESVLSPRRIGENVDCIYRISGQPTHTILDPNYARQIQITHQNASDVVLWNPWHKPTGGMSEQGYKTMVCVETARIATLLSPNEQVSVIIRTQPQE